MRYNIEISELAEEQFDKILSYIDNKFKNKQAVMAVLNDYDRGIETLEENAEIFEFCQNEKLRNLKLRKLGFEKHKYLFVYRVVENTVFIEGIYHESQAYEKMF